ncbi:MAG: hypothetical protein ACRCXN_12970 [Bacteroidales bacterium]
MAIPDYYAYSVQEQQAVIDEFASKTGCDTGKVFTEIGCETSRKYKNTFAVYANLANCKQVPEGTQHFKGWTVFEWLNY